LQNIGIAENSTYGYIINADYPKHSCSNGKNLYGNDKSVFNKRIFQRLNTEFCR